MNNKGFRFSETRIIELHLYDEGTETLDWNLNLRPPDGQYVNLRPRLTAPAGSTYTPAKGIPPPSHSHEK